MFCLAPVKSTSTFSDMFKNSVSASSSKQPPSACVGRVAYGNLEGPNLGHLAWGSASDVTPERERERERERENKINWRKRLIRIKYKVQ